MISYLYTHQTHHYIYITMSFCLPCARMYHLCDQDSRLSGKDKFWKLRLKREPKVRFPGSAGTQDVQMWTQQLHRLIWGFKTCIWVHLQP